MAATFPVPTGTFTTQQTTFPAKTDRNVSILNSVHQNDLRTVPPEIDQIVNHFATGYNTTYWAAMAWLRAQLTAACLRQTPGT